MLIHDYLIVFLNITRD